jgi:hypothetical protein
VLGSYPIGCMADGAVAFNRDTLTKMWLRSATEPGDTLAGSDVGGRARPVMRRASGYT